MNRSRRLLVTLAAMAAIVLGASISQAQCTTCATPTVAYYQPAVQTVAYQPTVTYQPYTGWYPGRLLDRWRLRRWSRRTENVQTSAAAPYVASYAPLQNSATQTAYRPVVAPSYVPTTSYRPVIMRPVVTMRPVVSMSPVVQTSYTAVDAGCDPCASQATYAPVDSGCSSCTDAYSSGSSYSAPATSSAPSNGGYYGPTTPQPTLNGVPTPADSRYRGGAAGEMDNGETGSEPEPAEVDESSTGLDAPMLLSPLSDQLTRRPSVEVHHAVYRPNASKSNASARPATARRRPAPKNVDGWHSAP